MAKLYVAINDLLVYGSAITRPTGIQRVATGLSAALAARHRATHVVVSDSGIREVTPPTAGRRSIAARIAEPALWLLARAPRRVQESVRTVARAVLGRLARQRGGDIIEPHGEDWVAVIGAPWIAPGMVRAIEIAKETHKVNVALLVHDLLPATSPQWFADAQGESAKRDIETLIRCADAVFAVSGEVVSELQQRYQKPASLLMPADPELQPAVQLQESDLRAEKERIILSVGTLHPRKNLVALVRIWERWCVQVLASGDLIDTVPRLVLAGRRHPQDGELFRVLRESQHASTRIQLVHDADDRMLASLYRQSRFVVMPSLAEGWGLPIREALLAGRPSIATDAVPAAAGSPYVCAVPAGDEVALEAAIKSWWTGNEPERLSKAITENFRPRTWGEVADEFYQAISASEVRR